MNILERIAVSVRRSSPLPAEHPLWRAVRPVYRDLLQRVGHRGLERRINGLDTIRLLPELYTLGEIYEPEVWRCVMDELKPSDTVVDVGASLGLYTLAIAQRLGGEGRVYAFEPDPGTARLLQRMVGLNDLAARVVIAACAVGDQPGTTRFASGHGVESHVSLDGDEEAIDVEIVTLDSAFPSASVDIIKVDVEGYEQHVLLGAERLLTDPRRAPRALFLEVHPFAWDTFGVTSESLLGLLSSYHYDVYDLSRTPVRRIDAYGEVVARKR